MTEVAWFILLGWSYCSGACVCCIQDPYGVALPSCDLLRAVTHPWRVGFERSRMGGNRRCGYCWMTHDLAEKSTKRLNSWSTELFPLGRASCDITLHGQIARA
jgi:hypothetical protein